MTKRQLIKTAAFLRGVADGLEFQAGGSVRPDKPLRAGAETARAYVKDGGAGTGLDLIDYLNVELPEFTGEGQIPYPPTLARK